MENLRIENCDGCALVSFQGELTMEVTLKLKKILEERIAAPEVSAVAVDLSAVPFMDSSGIGFLVALSARTKGAGKEFILLSPSTQVRKTLALVQLLSFFTIRESLDPKSGS